MEGEHHELQFLRRSNSTRQHVLSGMRCSTRCLCIERLCAPASAAHATQPANAPCAEHPTVPSTTAHLRPCLWPSSANAAREQHATHGSGSTRHASGDGSRLASATEPSPRHLPSATAARRHPAQPVSSQSVPAPSGQRDARHASSTSHRHAESAARSFHRQRGTSQRQQRFTVGGGRHQDRSEPRKFAYRCHGESTR